LVAAICCCYWYYQLDGGGGKEEEGEEEVEEEGRMGFGSKKGDAVTCGGCLKVRAPLLKNPFLPHQGRRKSNSRANASEEHDAADICFWDTMRHQGSEEAIWDWSQYGNCEVP
jgi:hypothetical protein